MHHPFQETALVKADVFTSLPAWYRSKGRNDWTEPNRGGLEVECFLEGPAFDREGNLWVVDIPFGRIFRIDHGGNGRVGRCVSRRPACSRSGGCR